MDGWDGLGGGGGKDVLCMVGRTRILVCMNGA